MDSHTTHNGQHVDDQEKTTALGLKELEEELTKLDADTDLTDNRLDDGNGDGDNGQDSDYKNLLDKTTDSTTTQDLNVDDLLDWNKPETKEDEEEDMEDGELKDDTNGKRDDQDDELQTEDIAKLLQGIIKSIRYQTEISDKRNRSIKKELKTLNVRVNNLQVTQEATQTKRALRSAKTALIEAREREEQLHKEISRKEQEMKTLKEESKHAQEALKKELKTAREDDQEHKTRKDEEIKALETMIKEERQKVKELNNRLMEKERKRKTPQDPDVADLLNTVAEIGESAKKRKLSDSIPATIGHLGDSHLKGVIFSPDIEATVMEHNMEELIRVKGGAPLDELLELPVETFDGTTGMWISGGQRELLEGWESLSNTQKGRRVTEVADRVLEIIQKYLNAGKKVIYMSPPIARTSKDKPELQLEKEIMEKLPNGATVAQVATKHNRQILKTSWERGMEDYMKDRLHMRVSKFEEMYEHYSREVFNLSISKGGKASINKQTTRKIKQEGRCVRCASKGCGNHQSCNRKVECSMGCRAKDHHDSRVCPTQRRPCFRCGMATQHDRHNCTEQW